MPTAHTVVKARALNDVLDIGLKINATIRSASAGIPVEAYRALEQLYRDTQAIADLIVDDFGSK